MIIQYDFFRTKYGQELLIDLIRLEDLEKYIKASPVQRLSYYDITVITSGYGSLVIDLHEQPLEQETVFFSSPGQVRKWNTDDTPKGYVLIFEDEFLYTFFNDTQFIRHLSFFHTYEKPPVLQLTSDDYYKLATLFQDVKNEIVSFKEYDKHILRALLYQILIFLNRKFISVYPSTEKKPMNRYIKEFIRLVDIEYRRYRTVEHYAQQLAITGGHLNSLVKDYFGVSAKRYILGRNLLEAKRMLQYTDMSIDEIAAFLNYENTTYFVRVFKEHTGATPLHFRKQRNP